MLIITTQTLAISKAHPPNTSIFFKGNHIYHAIIVHVNANINSVPISGINKIIERTIKFIIVNWTKNLLTNPFSLISSFLFANQYAMNIIYQTLKNSEGCILGRGQRSTQPLASQFVA
jgi:hypothetical protein